MVRILMRKKNGGLYSAVCHTIDIAKVDMPDDKIKKGDVFMTISMPGQAMEDGRNISKAEFDAGAILFEDVFDSRPATISQLFPERAQSAQSAEPAQ